MRWARFCKLFTLCFSVTFALQDATSTADEPPLLTPLTRTLAPIDEADAAAFPEVPPEPPSPPTPGEAAEENNGVAPERLAAFRAVGAAHRLAAPGDDIPHPTPAEFRGVTPTVTTREELLELWGEPEERIASEESQQLRYAATPFARIEVELDEGVVSSIVAHLREPATLAAVATMLKLENSVPAAIYDEKGSVLGRVHPERGVLLGLIAAGEERLVAQIAVEPIAAEGFLLRAEQQRRLQPQLALADARLALRLQPQSSRAAAIVS
ncbi:MAG: hypothetical protein KY475_15140, partial [Planctomycetes bacterium]|nr:hypothetical protein [Planctomycetota bacterium]